MSDVTADEAEAEVRGRASTGRQAPEASPPAGPEPGRGAEPGVQPCAEAPEGDALPDVPPAGVTGGHDPQYLPYAPLWTPVIERNLAMLLEWIVADMRGCLLSRPLVGKSLPAARRGNPTLLGGAVILSSWATHAVARRRCFARFCCSLDVGQRLHAVRPSCLIV
jgi:hypothetical protein